MQRVRVVSKLCVDPERFRLDSPAGSMDQRNRRLSA